MFSSVVRALLCIIRRVVSPSTSACEFGPGRLLTALAVLLALFGATRPADGQTTFTCSSATPSANCALSVTSTQTTASQSTLTVSGAPGPVATVQVELEGVTTNGSQTLTNPGWSLQVSEFLLTSPTGAEFDILAGTGDGIDGDDVNGVDSGDGLHGLNITISDSATQVAPYASGDSGNFSNNWPATGSETVKPSSYYGYPAVSLPLGVYGDWPQSDGCNPENPDTFDPPGCFSGSAPTMSGHLAGSAANGTWTLTLINGEGITSPISITGWSLILTFSEATPTVTTVSSSANPTNIADSVTFTATVTPSDATGTINFTANTGTISGCGAKALSGGQAQCTTTLAQGGNAIEAIYTPTGSFGQSSGSMTQVMEVTPTQSGNTWCNSSSIFAPGNLVGVAYPAVIHVSGYADGATVSDVTSVELEGATGPAGVNAYHLLVAPNGQNNLDFFDSTFSYNQPGSPVNLTIEDGGSAPSGSSPPSTGTYEPYDGNVNGVAQDFFPTSPSPSADANIPQVPGTINRAAPLGGTSLKTFEEAFSNAPANGDWALYVYAGGGESETINNGWCLTLDVNTGVGTTTTLTSTQNPQTTGQSVTLTASVVEQGSNNPVTSGGTVTFLDNGQSPAGVANNTVTLNGSGQAAITTSSLIEGDHVITATYNGTPTDNGSFTTMTQRMNDATQLYASGAAIPNGGTCSATYCYCNPGAVSTTSSYRGAFTPDPSVISVANLPGTIDSVTLGLNQYSSATDILYSLESMVVGPTGADLDFFSNAGWNGGIGGTADLGNYLFSDTASGPISSTVTTLSPGTYQPSSYVQGDPNYPEPAQPYFGGFYTPPSTITYAGSRGSGTLSSQFADTDPNGIWSLYMSEIDAAGSASAAHGWCVNFTVNPVAVTVDESHSGTGTGGDFIQGETGAQITTTITNNGSGPTGDPTAGSNPLKVVDTLNSALTYESFSGTGWSCSAAGQTVTCTNDSAIASGSSYPTLTLNVDVSGTASGSIGNSASVSGAGITSNSGNDTISIQGSASLAISKSHTGNFTQGSTGVWTLVVSNTASTGSTSGTVTVSDTLPTGYTLSSSTSTGSLFSCSGTSTVTCTGTPGIAAGGSDTITLTVNVPANSPTSVSNTASTWGGGDPVHTSAGSAAASNTDTVTVIATTTTTAANETAAFSASSQSVALGATVTSGAGTVNSGTVTFTVMQGATQIGSATAPASVSNGNAAATYTLPGGTNAGTYTIVASYTAAGNFTSSSDNSHTLTVNAAGTTISSANQSTTFSSSVQIVTLSATVTSAAGAVNAGTVTFTVLNGGTPIGTATTSGTVASGSASVSYTLPAGTLGGIYTIQAVYNGSTDFTSSTDNTHTLTITGGATTTSASSVSATYNSFLQPVILNATITSGGGTVNSGTITFTVMQGATQIGTAAGPATVNNGSATAIYTLPGGTDAGTYTIVASYTGAGGFTSSSDNTHTLAVNAASTTTTGSNQTATFSSNSQVVMLSATVSSAAGTVNGGTVTFTVLNGGTPIGTATTSGTIASGSASANYILPAGVPVGAYTIRAVYSGSTDFTGSVDATHMLTVGAAGTTTIASNASATYNANNTQSVTLTAAVNSSNGVVNEGTVTFTVLNGSTPVGSAVMGPVSGGSASATFALPAGTAIGSYTIQALYTDPSGDFTTSNDGTHSLAVNPIPSFIVTNTNDSGSGSLRAALASATSAGGGNITFDPGAFGSGGTIVLQSGLTIPDNTTITGLASGSGASLQNLVTVNGAGGANGQFSIFTVNLGANAAIVNLTIASGVGGSFNGVISGGGILNRGTLTVTGSNFSGNSVGSSGEGGAIDNYTGGTLSVTGSNFSNNTAGQDGEAGAIANSGVSTVANSTFSGNTSALGGAIGNNNGGSTLTVTGSTFSANSVDNNAQGGAIYNGGGMTVTNSTFSGNSGQGDSTGGAIFNTGGLTVADSTFSGNSAGPTGTGGGIDNTGTLTITNSIFAHDTDGECSGVECPVNGTNGNIVDPAGTLANLAALGNYGGSTQTMIPLPGSAAICVGSASLASSAGITSDQRGYALNAGGYCTAGSLDAGAVQTNYAISFTAPVSNVAPSIAMAPAPAVTLDESGMPFSGAAVTIPLSLTSSPAGATLSGGSASTSAGVATYSSLTVNQPGTGDQLTATLVLNSSPAVSLSAQSGTFNVARITPTLSFTPSPASQTYGIAIAAGSLNATASDNNGNVQGTFAYTTMAGGNPVTLVAGTTILPAGTYTVTATFTPTNTTVYTGATATASYTVNAAMLTITASSGSMTYGGTVPTIAPSYSGFVNGDSSASLTTQPACSTTATSHSAVGSYPSSCSGAVDANYMIGYTAGSVTVGQAALTIAANNATKTYGTANPTFSGLVTGQQNGDTFTESFSTTAMVSSPVGAYTIVPSVTGTDLSDYTPNIVDGTLTVAQAASITTVGLSSAAITPGQSETITITVASSTTGTPTGSVSIYDGTTLLTTATLTGGMASYTTATLAPGVTHVISAVYSGDTNFTGSTSTASASVTVAPLDFTMTITGPSSTTVIPGQSVSYQVTVTPLYGSYAGTVNFAVTGLPVGASVTFSPASIAANGGPQTVTVTIATAPVTAVNRAPASPTRRAAPLTLAFLLLFGLGAVRRRGRKVRRLLAIVLLLAGGAAATLVSGCGGGFFAQAPQNYDVTLTATAANLQHSVNVTLNVQ